MKIKTKKDLKIVLLRLRRLSSLLEFYEIDNHHNTARAIFNQQYGVGWRENWEITE